jgi:polyhydroxyalkanoate synthesis regulator phasin
MALEEVRLIDEGKIKPQPARQMLDELKKELADENQYYQNVTPQYFYLNHITNLASHLSFHKFFQ